MISEEVAVKEYAAAEVAEVAALGPEAGIISVAAVGRGVAGDAPGAPTFGVINCALVESVASAAAGLEAFALVG